MEFNNHYREQLKKAGLEISGTSPNGELVEIIELRTIPGSWDASSTRNSSPAP